MTELKVFTATGCANCMQVKDYLKKAGIEFVERNIAESPEAMEELKRLGTLSAPDIVCSDTIGLEVCYWSGLLSVPVIACGDKIIHGFDLAGLDELIASLRAAV